MARIRKVSAVTGLALLIFFMAFGCSLLLKDDNNAGEQIGRYIKLNIHGQPSSKAITVTEYEVTGLDIVVKDPDGDLIQTIAWKAADGSTSYLIPVTQQGLHKIFVTHIGTKNSQVVQAEESATFNIQAMVITVIDITPGCIGVINVSGGGAVPQDPNAWLYGYWVQESVTATPRTVTLELKATNGDLIVWQDYFATRVFMSGKWSLQGLSLTLAVGNGPSGTVEITKVSDDQWSMPGEQGQGGGTWYRQGTEPAEWVFDQTPIELAVGERKEAFLEDQHVDLYRLDVDTAGNYEVMQFSSDQTDPNGNPYTLEYGLSAYASDQRTCLTWDEVKVFSLNPAEPIYIIISCGQSGIGGSYAMLVTQVP